MCGSSGHRQLRAALNIGLRRSAPRREVRHIVQQRLEDGILQPCGAAASGNTAHVQPTDFIERLRHAVPALSAYAYQPSVPLLPAKQSPSNTRNARPADSEPAD
jgi:hypothetical protein